MSESVIKLFIVEGEDRDYRFINEMITLFFRGKYESRTICLPTAQNIYMLYSKLKEDAFETDVVEVLRDLIPSASKALEGISRQQIDEVFLFFDYDVQQKNLTQGSDQKTVLAEMLDFFDNETDHGKLYLSYPMVEALYDYKDGQCESYTGCFIAAEEIGGYKTLSGSDNLKASQHRSIDDWRMILGISVLRLSCLFDEEIDFREYRKVVEPRSVYERQDALYTQKQVVFVFSGLPEFLLDYFRESFWYSMVRMKNTKMHTCSLRLI